MLSLLFFVVEVPDGDSHPERRVEIYRYPESMYLYNDILTEDSHPERRVKIYRHLESKYL